MQKNVLIEPIVSDYIIIWQSVSKFNLIRDKRAIYSFDVESLEFHGT